MDTKRTFWYRSFKSRDEPQKVAIVPAAVWSVSFLLTDRMPLQPASVSSSAPGERLPVDGAQFRRSVLQDLSVHYHS
jgi:hypothetical protein